MLRRLLPLVCALGLFLAACVPPEESNDRLKRYDPEENIMGVIQDRGVMRIGVPIDYPPFAISDGADVQGFVVELGTLAAEALGVEPEFIPAPSYSLLSMVYVDEERPEAPTEADLVFPMAPITEELVQEWTLTDPYWISHDHELVDGQRFIREGDDYRLLREAFSNPGYELAGEAQSTSGLGAAVRTGAATFATLVSQVFNEADAEGDWSRFYEEWLADYYAEPNPDAVPIMTVEDAAALYPTELE
jgi:ABC-type amino acid transport substrate-binding protein